VTGWKFWLFGITSLAAVFLLRGWGLMLTFGAAHLATEQIPAIGFIASLWLNVAIDVIANGRKTADKVREAFE